jgi:hypothetical protein
VLVGGFHPRLVTGEPPHDRIKRTWATRQDPVDSKLNYYRSAGPHHHPISRHQELLRWETRSRVDRHGKKTSCSFEATQAIQQVVLVHSLSNILVMLGETQRCRLGSGAEHSSKDLFFRIPPSRGGNIVVDLAWIESVGLYINHGRH